MKTQKNIPVFLKNTPIGEDLFEGKSQETTADTICNVLETPDFQIIGIDGAWGTGKSNLVHIIQKKLQNKGFHFFLFDVWGHQEDDQRRAILEELTDQIVTKGVIKNNAKWENRYKKLLAKEREITTINRPFLSLGIIFTLFSIIYIPTVTVFVKDMKCNHWGITPFWWKIIVVGFPLLLILITFIYHFIKLKEKPFGERLKEAVQITFQIYNNKQLDETKIETISENAPSVKDFRKWMREIDEDLIGKKLVLVFDNFDRLPKGNIVALWSSIHVFFAEEKYKNIKVIIPFDRNHIQNAFSDLDAKPSVESEPNPGLRNYSGDYINKTFDIVYRVSPPIMSNWKIYFKTKWQEAFGESEDVEYSTVEYLYDVFNNTITPREIIVFINEIVALKMLFSEKIPTHYFALFILNKDVILKNPLREISNPTYLGGVNYLYQHDSDLPKYLAAIVYQIDPEKAIEVVYTKELKNTLVNGDFESFKDLTSSNLWTSVIDGIIDSLNNVEIPIVTIDKLDRTNITKLVTDKLDLVWIKLYDKARSYEFSEFGVKTFQLILFKYLDLERSNQWINKLFKGFYNHISFNATNFCQVVDQMNDYFSANDIKIDISDYLNETNLKVEEFVEFAANKKDKFGFYKLVCSESELNSYFSSLEFPHIMILNYLKYLTPEYDLSGFRRTMEGRLESEELNAIELTIILNILKQISDGNTITSLSDEEINRFIEDMDESNEIYADLIAMRLSKGGDFDEGDSVEWEAILEVDNQDQIEKLEKVVLYYSTIDELLSNFDYFRDFDLYRGLISRMILSEELVNCNLLNLLTFIDKIIELSELDEGQVLNQLERVEFKGITSKNVIQIPYNVLTFIKQHRPESLLLRNITKHIKEYFNELRKNDWLVIFNSSSSNEFSLLRLFEFEYLNSYSFDALRELMISSLKKNTNPQLIADLVDGHLLHDLGIPAILKDIRDKFYNDSELITGSSFLLYVPYLLKNDILVDRPEESFRTIFKSEFLDNENTLKILIDNSVALKKLMKLTTNNNKKYFIKSLEDRMNRSKSITSLVEKLDIKTEKNNKNK